MQFVPATGPWFMTYRVGPRTLGLMLSTSDHDIALSGGALGHAVVVGWRCRRCTFRERKHAIGRDHGPG